jgi:hypothetical protein
VRLLLGEMFLSWACGRARQIQKKWTVSTLERLRRELSARPENLRRELSARDTKSHLSGLPGVKTILQNFLVRVKE